MTRRVREYACCGGMHVRVLRARLSDLVRMVRLGHWPPQRRHRQAPCNPTKEKSQWPGQRPRRRLPLLGPVCTLGSSLPIEFTIIHIAYSPPRQRRSRSRYRATMRTSMTPKYFVFVTPRVRSTHVALTGSRICTPPAHHDWHHL